MSEIQDKSYFYQFYVAVDCIIFGFDEDGLKILLCKRGFEPGKGQWSLLGGFLNPEESLDQAAARVLTKITGLTDIYLEQIHTYGDIGRDLAARVVSTAYFALIKINDFNKDLIEEFSARWWPINQYPELIFDHDKMVKNAFHILQAKAKQEPVGFELLPKSFTITQLRNLYEAIYQKSLDPGNFRKKLLSMKILEKLTIKDKSNSKRGAFLYEFNEERYERLKAQGFLFDL